MTGIAWRATLTEPVRLVRSTPSKTSAGTSSVRPYATTPAQWTTASMRPCCDVTAVDHLLDLGVVADVGRQDERRRGARGLALPRHLLQRRLAPGDQHDMVAGGRRLQRDGPADAARRARDDEDPGVRGHGLSTTLTQPSCFFWNISYAAGRLLERDVVRRERLDAQQVAVVLEHLA